MKKLFIESTANSPKVNFDPENNVYEISGESRPPNVPVFYGQLIEWIKDFSGNISRKPGNSGMVEFNLDFNYFNSSSAKYILDFCKLVSAVRSGNDGIKIRWHYESDDPDMLEVGKEMERMAKMPFEFIRKDRGSSNPML
jgi:hypothetical protein